MKTCPNCFYTTKDDNEQQCPNCIYRSSLIDVSTLSPKEQAKAENDCIGTQFFLDIGRTYNNTYIPPTQEELDKLEHTMKVNQFIQEYKQEVEEGKPKCPICQSTNLSKISTLKKAAKVGLFGIFGAGDIGKAWKCNNCGSRF